MIFNGALSNVLPATATPDPGHPRQEFLLDFKKCAQYTRHLAWFAAP
jgi:hypothetical protein